MAAIIPPDRDPENYLQKLRQTTNGGLQDTLYEYNVDVETTRKRKNIGEKRREKEEKEK